VRGRPRAGELRKRRRRFVEAEEQAAHAQERTREALRANEALSKPEKQSRLRAEQSGLLASVTRRSAGSMLFVADALAGAAGLYRVMCAKTRSSPNG